MQPPSPYPDFSVSPSSIRRLDGCPRAHYWAVYGSWGGWDSRLPPSNQRRVAYTLKQGTSLAGLVGKVVHQVAQTLIDGAQSGIPTSMLEVMAHAGMRYSEAVRYTLAN